jgi:hypothetical protein
MMGDILGVPLRKESYVQKDKDEGEAAGGFTFDGSFHFLEGNPAEIISRQLNYLDLSPWSWWRADDGWMSLGLGEASDNIERILLMSAPGEDGQMALYAIGRKVTHLEDDKKSTGPWVARVLAQGNFAELSERAELTCSQYGNAGLAMRNKSWRKQPPSDAQIAFARRLRGAWKPGYTRGELAQSITHAQALKAIEALRYGGLVVPQEALQRAQA